MFNRKMAGLVCLLVFSFLGARAQNIGVNRGNIKWRQVNTEAARVIYPVGQDSIAFRVATLTEELARKHAGTIGPKLNKVDIVLQAENTLSNAYVGLGPYRSEFYMTPPQNPFALGANNWADQLAIHEFRHAQQYSNFNVGLSKLGSVFGGQYGRAIANSMAVPDWFWEGDAIWNETVHTSQGRGRIPYFFNAYKSLGFGQKQYNWMKLRNGSLKDFVPNHYDLGYLLVAYGRQKAGDSVWSGITKDAASFKGLFYPVEKASEKRMGTPYKQFTSDALKYFSDEWQKEYKAPSTWVTSTQHNSVVHYKYPYPKDDGGWVALKTGYRQVPTFIGINAAGEEYKIAVKDIGYDDYFSYANGRIAYTAYQPDHRWQNREYSVIRILDLADGRQHSISSKSRYFSPDITKDGEKIVAVELVTGRAAQLHVLNKNGEVLHQASFDSSWIYSHPKWVDNGERVVVAIRNPQGQMGWILWEIGKNTYRLLMKPADRLVGFPVVQGDTMVYTHSANGTDGLRAMLISSGEVMELQQFATGIYQGFLQGERLVGSVFTADGFRLAAWDAYSGRPLDVNSDQMPSLYVNQGVTDGEDLGKLPSKQFTSEKYRKSIKLLNFHSWIPEPNEPDYTFTLVGENVLSTLGSEIYYNYNTNESSSKLGARFTYGNSYIMPFVNGSQTWSREIRYNADTTFTFNETELGAGLLLPLNLTGGKYYRSLNISSAVNLEKNAWTGMAKDLLRDQDYTASVNRLTYVAQSQKAIQHIYPRFGQTLILDYRTLISEQTAKQFLASGALYLPGMHVNHNLVVTAAYQGRDTMRQYFFTNSFPFSRGYNVINYPRMWKVGLNYHFPLLYPDWGFGGILYFRRIRANAFYDYTIGKSLRTGLTTPFSSVGGELFFDMKFWNIQTFTPGIRYSYLIDTDLLSPTRTGLFEFVLPINLFGN